MLVLVVSLVMSACGASTGNSSSTSRWSVHRLQEHVTHVYNYERMCRGFIIQKDALSRMARSYHGGSTALSDKSLSLIGGH